MLDAYIYLTRSGRALFWGIELNHQNYARTVVLTKLMVGGRTAASIG